MELNCSYGLLGVLNAPFQSPQSPFLPLIQAVFQQTPPKPRTPKKLKIYKKSQTRNLPQHFISYIYQDNQHIVEVCPLSPKNVLGKKLCLPQQTFPKIVLLTNTCLFLFQLLKETNGSAPLLKQKQPLSLRRSENGQLHNKCHVK